MRIVKLIIQGFGQFKNKTFDFKPGLNIIEGLNESGKTTLHAFIEAMFYGFVNPETKVKKLLESHDRYEPKATDVYGGSMIIEHEKTLYRITRNLKKRNRDPLTIIKESTGEDITKTLDIDPVSKTADIGKWLNIPYTLYQNTLSIRQLEARTSDNVGELLMQRLSNLTTAASESLSPQKAIKSLEEELTKIGTDRASTKPYAKNLADIEQLNTQKAAVLKMYETLLALKTDVEKEKQTVYALTQSKTDLEQQITAKENTIKRKRYEMIDALMKEKEAKTIELESLSAYKTFNPDDLEHYQALNHHIKTTQERIQENAKRIEALEKDITELQKTTENAVDMDAVKEDRRKLLEFDRQIDLERLQTLRVAQKESIEQTTQLNTKRKALELKQSRALKRWFLIIPLVIGFIYAVKLTKLNTALMHIRNQKDVIDADLNTIEAIVKKRDALLDKHHVDDLEAFEDYYEDVLAQINIKRAIEEKQESIETFTKQQSALKSTLKKDQEALDKLSAHYDVTDYEGLKNTRDKHKQYRAHQREIDNITTRINDYLDGLDYQAFKASIDFQAPHVKTDDLETIQNRLAALLESIQNKKLSIERNESTIETQEKQHEPLEAIEQKLLQCMRKKEAFDQERSVIEQAIKRIETATKAIEENFAPVLSASIKTYLKQFTDARYSDIRVAKDLLFKVYDHRYEQFESALHFSQGTTDQVYFAMRLGMLDALNQKTLPLLLDDAFVSYDDHRLNHVLEVLKTMIKSRQIILFTCQRREHHLSEKTALKHHYITL